MDYLKVENDGPDIMECNYWDTEMAKKGLVYVSINDKTFRVLIPDQLCTDLDDMKSGKYAIVTTGPFRGQLGMEILFEDKTDNPYQLTIGQGQLERIPAEEDTGRTDLHLSVWSGGPQKEFEIPARYRRASLPCLKPWK